jgi:YHS domain-containing protein
MGIGSERPSTLAARVSGLAGGNQVLLTDATRRAAGELDGIEFRRHGPKRFKNVNKPVEIFGAAHEGERREGLPIDPVCRMAVAPEQAVGRLIFEDLEYHFCLLACARTFTAAPEEYVRPE